MKLRLYLFRCAKLVSPFLIVLSYVTQAFDYAWGIEIFSVGLILALLIEGYILHEFHTILRIRHTGFVEHVDDLIKTNPVIAVNTEALINGDESPAMVRERVEQVVRVSFAGGIQYTQCCLMEHEPKSLPVNSNDQSASN